MMKRASILVTFFLLAASTSNSHAVDEKPKENPALPETASKVIDALGAITDSTGKALETSRINERAALLRSAAYVTLLGGKPDLTTRALLCVPRGTYAADVAQRAYLLQISGMVQKTATVEISGFIAAFSSFGETIELSAPPALKVSQIPTKTIDACMGDIDKSFNIYFGLQPVNKAGLIDEAISLWNLVSGLVKTAVVDTATFVAEQKRRAAILLFFKQNSDKIASVSKNLLDHLAADLKLNRATAGATYFNAQDAFSRTLQKSLADVKDKACKSILDDSVANPPKQPRDSREFWSCWRSYWNSDVSNSAKVLLEAASAYDSVADLGLTSPEGAKAVLDNAISAVKTNEKFSFERFLTVSNQILGIAKDYQTLFSQDTRDKVRKSVDTIIVDINDKHL